MPLMAFSTSDFVVGRRHILGAHALEYIAENRQLLVGLGARSVRSGCGQAHTQGSWRTRPSAHRQTEATVYVSFPVLPANFRPPWGRIDGFSILAELDVEHWSSISHRNRCVLAIRASSSHRPALLRAQTGPGDADFIHSRQDDMISVACVKDQELTV